MLKKLFYFVALIVIISCKHEEVEVTESLSNDFFSTSSNFINENQKFIITLNKENTENVEIFAQLHHGFQDGKNETVKPQQVNDSTYTLLLTDSTISYVTLVLFKNEHYLFLQNFPYYRNNKPATYALTAHLRNNQLRLYDSLCNNYEPFLREPFYYLEQWYFLFNNNWLTDEIIKQDLVKVQKIPQDNSTKDFVEYYGNKLLSHKNHVNQEQLFKVLNYDVLNNQIACSFLSIILYKGFEPINLSIVQEIMSNYPNSYFTFLRIGDGTLLKIDQNIARNILEERLKSNPNDEKSHVYLAYIELNSFDNYQKADSISTYLYSNMNAKDYFKNIENPFYNLKDFRKLFVQTLIVSRLKQLKYQNVIEFISNELSNYSATENFKSVLYEHLGDAYYEVNDKKSAKLNYLKSIKISSNKIVKAKLNEIVKYNDFDFWLNDTLSNIKIESKELINLPNIFTPDSSYDISGKNDFILLNFYETTCAPCLLNIKEIEKFKNSFSNLKVFYISPENIEITEKFIKKINKNNYVVLNGKQITNYFENISYPNTILIHNNNIIFEMSGGSSGTELTNKIISKIKSIKK